MMFLQQANALAACQALLTVLPGQVYWPGSTDYTTASTGVWSKTCVLTPECVFEPQTVVSSSGPSVFILQLLVTVLSHCITTSTRFAPETFKIRKANTLVL